MRRLPRVQGDYGYSFTRVDVGGHVNTYTRCLTPSLPPSGVRLHRSVGPTTHSSMNWSSVSFGHSCPFPPLCGCRASPVSGGAPLRAASLPFRPEPRAQPLEGHRAAFWQESMSEQLWRFPGTIQIAFFTPHCTTPALSHIICAHVKCTLSDPSPCKTLQEESVAPVCC